MLMGTIENLHISYADYFFSSYYYLIVLKV